MWARRRGGDDETSSERPPPPLPPLGASVSQRRPDLRLDPRRPASQSRPRTAQIEPVCRPSRQGCRQHTGRRSAMRVVSCRAGERSLLRCGPLRFHTGHPVWLVSERIMRSRFLRGCDRKGCRCAKAKKAKKSARREACGLRRAGKGRGRGRQEGAAKGRWRGACKGVEGSVEMAKSDGIALVYLWRRYDPTTMAWSPTRRVGGKRSRSASFRKRASGQNGTYARTAQA
jgi:hypothetical protein